MGKPTGFLEYTQKHICYRRPEVRSSDFNEFVLPLTEDERREQGARCMDCGVPFCQSNYGCPLGNLIPEWNDLIFQGKTKEAWIRLMKTNTFPEFTGRVCPAPCEGACVLGKEDQPVTIKDNERWITDMAYEQGWIGPVPVSKRTGKTVAIVGSGPAGLAAADQLNKAGHSVTVFERADRPGGLLMYGIPNMKLDKKLVERRLEIMKKEGVVFRTSAEVGTDIPAKKLCEDFDAVLLATGSTRPRDLPVPGRELKGIHFALDFLVPNTQYILDGQQAGYINTEKENVIVIGGGDTGNDCIGTSIRQGCSSVQNFELLPKPPAERDSSMPWPQFPRLYKSDYGHEEALAVSGRDPREYGILTKEFVGDANGAVKGVRTVRVGWKKNTEGRFVMEEIPGTEEFFEADRVFLALGFLGPEERILAELGVETDTRSNIKAEEFSYRTGVDKVFAAGDARRGQSLVVRAIAEGKGAAREIDCFLMGKTRLP
ncbi:glutamate synthase subunit beta [Brucepastera parasyntrophica]|uniref:glutamate synthase subunit beta n=1 Tax=Brucepastera parasyntrophica TaxID=2880008 RepID=UPI00210E38BF|nr:glutamate synthase subunit beta [Brucepastera parasyntrophica]ULQ58564.1 glutamate synthase subunit beta [Brucepastera parasyntrophica]